MASSGFMAASMGLTPPMPCAGMAKARVRSELVAATSRCHAIPHAAPPVHSQSVLQPNSGTPAPQAHQERVGHAHQACAHHARHGVRSCPSSRLAARCRTGRAAPLRAGVAAVCRRWRGLGVGSCLFKQRNELLCHRRFDLCRWVLGRRTVSSCAAAFLPESMALQLVAPSRTPCQAHLCRPCPPAPAQAARSAGCCRAEQLGHAC